MGLSLQAPVSCGHEEFVRYATLDGVQLWPGPDRHPGRSRSRTRLRTAAHSRRVSSPDLRSPGVSHTERPTRCSPRRRPAHAPQCTREPSPWGRHRFRWRSCRIRVRDKHCRAIHQSQRAARKLAVLFECAQRILHRRHRESARLQIGDHVGPARPVCIGTVHQHHIAGTWQRLRRGRRRMRGSRTKHEGSAAEGNGGRERSSIMSQT